VAEARGRAEDATREVEVSRRRADAVREHVVQPLREFADHNQFAAMLRATLAEDPGREE